MIRAKPAKRRCPQCWKLRALVRFIGARGKPVRICTICQKRYGNWSQKTPEERLRGRVARRGLRKQGELRVLFMGRSGNKKLGPIPASISSAETCPPSCSFYGNGCFAEFHVLRAHWSKVPERGLKWGQFLELIRALPEGQIWRHNVAGDLPGEGEELDVAKLFDLAHANSGRRGFSFSHKKQGPFKMPAIRRVNELGFTVNVSADSLEEADELASWRVPVAVVLPHDAPNKGIRTPAGRHVVVCPAETHGLTCARCQLCANADRKSIVGFKAHGQWKQRVTQLVQLRRKPEAA